MNTLQLCFFLLLLAGQAICGKDGDSETVPDTMECCRSKGIPDFCVQNLCNTAKPPDEFAIFTVASRCPSHLSKISQCLADGRNHMPCCKKNAKNIREECLHLCDGTATALNVSDWENYKRYLACLTFNIKSIYGCMSNNYLHSPTPPVDIEVVQTGATFASISWKPPCKLQSQTKRYRISYWQFSGFNHTSGSRHPLMVTTKDSIHRLSGLSPDTKYGSSVEALGSKKYGSLPSAVVTFVTRGVAPMVKSHHEEQQAGVGSIATFVCNIKIYGTQHSEVSKFFWQKQRSDGSWSDILKAEASQSIRKSVKNKSEMISYRVLPKSWGVQSVHSDTQLHYVTALRIHSVKKSTYGKYRCLAKNSFGEGSAVVTLKRVEGTDPPSTPANITACCEREGVNPSCLHSCKSNAALQDGEEDSGLPDFRCAMDVPIVLKCSTAGMSYDSCCLAKKVPRECLPFCDGSMGSAKKRLLLFGCLMHTTNILACHLEAKTPLPHPPTNIRIQPASAKKAKLSWESGSKAKNYYVYYRRKDSSNSGGDANRWRRRPSPVSRVILTSLASTAVYEIIVIASNDSGFSDTSKPFIMVVKNGIARQSGGLRGGETFSRSKRPSQFLEK